ncbi:MAG: NADH-quinone oxidoreductase subunit J [Chloroflexi bacterium]|nr:NADH-quinone oxidoreductase subunit J [Chloroflexota bacterium]MCY4246120.1 NADH-quinone oxidoreductase subunit J [Chloroflexota bacterium]
MELNAISIGFVVFTIFTLGGGVGVVTTRNLFQGTIWLMVSLFGVAGYFVLLSAPFLAAVQILVYIGAIAILITFAVMLTRSVTRVKARYIRLVPSLLASFALFLILLLGIAVPVFGEISPDIAPVTVASTRDLGAALVDENGYVVPFLLASVLLTGAMIGAIFIARDDTA